jgi:hypothetical protein
VSLIFSSESLDTGANSIIVERQTLESGVYIGKVSKQSDIKLITVWQSESPAIMP